MIDWHIHSESLVRGGEVVLDFDVIDNWKNKLDNMNEDKEGYILCIPRFVCSITRLYACIFSYTL